jgi:GT2 family glycosyltransferase
VGAFLAVRREAADSVGELDERFFLYSEEKDWCYRLRHAGWDVRHLPSLAVLHHTGGYGSAALRAQLTYSKVLFAQKHYGRRRRFGIRAGLALRHALRVATLSLLPAHRDPGRSRLMGERAALAVALGTARPQGGLAPVSRNGARPGKDAS